MGNDDVAMLVRLWREKREEVDPEDLSDNLIVQLGTVTEDLNRRWYERNTGHAIKHAAADPAPRHQMDGGHPPDDDRRQRLVGAARIAFHLQGSSKRA